MKKKIALTDDFLKALPAELASAVSDAAQDVEEKAIHRKSTSVDFKTDETSSSGYISTPQVDRDLEIVVPKGIDLEAYAGNPVLCFNHKWHEPPIGSQENVGPDLKGLFAKQNYGSTAFAQDIFTLVREKHLRTFSIGFMPLKRLFRGDEKFDGTLQELVNEYGDAIKNPEKAEVITTKSFLIENSVVTIPANTGATVMQVSKTLGLSPETVEALGIEVKDSEPEPEPEPKVFIRPLIRLVKRAESPTETLKRVDFEKMVQDKIDLMKGGV